LEGIDSVIEEFHNQNPSIPAQSLRDLLNKKMKEMGWSHLTKREASLILTSEVKKSIKEIQEFGTLNKQTKPISGEITSGTIRKKYLQLISDQKNLKNSKTAVAILLLAMFITFLTSTYIGNFLTIGFPDVFVIPAALLITSLIVAIYSNRFVLKKESKLFFYVCGIYWKLNEFIHHKTVKKQIDILDFVEKISDNALNWSYRATPPPFSKQSDRFYEAIMNLWTLIGEVEVDKNKIIDPAENDKKITELETFNEKLKPQVDLTFDRQLFTEELPNFIKIFELIRKRKTEQIPQPKEKVELFFRKNKIVFRKNRIVFRKRSFTVIYFSTHLWCSRLLFPTIFLPRKRV